MSRLPRQFVFDPLEVGVYHCINRCVRRSMLCGWDPLTQRSYEHRQVWLQERLIFLASVMAIDLEGFCTMGNHLHLIVRNRPDVAGKWSAEEIARKWLQLCPPYKPGTREVAETPSQADLDAILNNPARVEQLRLRLSNPSWLMRFVTEKLARVANREERTTGRFWEGRFKMQRLLDEWAVAACLVYVDLNPIRAGITNMLSHSEHTAVFERLAGVVHSFATTLSAQQRQEYGLEGEAPVDATQPSIDGAGGEEQTGTIATTAATPNREQPSRPQPAALAQTKAPANPQPIDRSAWSRLSSEMVNEASRQAAFDGPTTWLAPLEITESVLQQAVPASRASNLGCLNMTCAQYLELLEWTGRQAHPGKVGRIAAEEPPILQQLGVAGEGWLKLVASFHTKRGGLRRAIGRPASLEAEAAKRGQRWIQGIALSREIFGQTSGERPSEAN
ncbi:MAG: transposase [Planctomycetaceae bacterium]